MPYVDVQFGIQGDLIPADHGYLLFAAVSGVVPSLHGDDGIGIHPISGPPTGNRLQALTERSCLTLRLPAERIKEVLTLAGRALKIGEHTIRVGVPHTRALIPHPRLYSRLAVIKGFLEPEPFLDAVKRQLDALEVSALPQLVEQSEIKDANRSRRSGSHSQFLRRTIKIRDKEIVGFAVRVEWLSDEESLSLQEAGIGGRRRFGCGIFVPVRR